MKSNMQRFGKYLPPWTTVGALLLALVAARFGAACLLEQLQATKGPRFSGVPAEVPTVLRWEIAAFQPRAPKFMTCPVETDVNLSADRDGGVRVDGRGRLVLENSRLQIVPAATLAPEQPKQPK